MPMPTFWKKEIASEKQFHEKNKVQYHQATPPTRERLGSSVKNSVEFLSSTEQLPIPGDPEKFKK